MSSVAARLAALGPFDPDAARWANAVRAAGSSVSLSRLAIVSQFIIAEKATRLWLLTDDYMGFWAENSTQARMSLKQRRLATAVNSPTFTADRNFTFNGTTSYLDTGHVPNTHATAMTVGSAHYEVYERTNVAANASPFGTASSSNRALNTHTRSAGNTLLHSVGVITATYSLAVITSAGLTQAGRNGGNLTSIYAAKNGVDQTRTVDPTVLSGSLPVHSFYVGGANQLGVFAQAKAASVGYVAWGAALDGAQRLARYINVQAWAAAVGAQV